MFGYVLHKPLSWCFCWVWVHSEEHWTYLLPTRKSKQWPKAVQLKTFVFAETLSCGSYKYFCMNEIFGSVYDNIRFRFSIKNFSIFLKIEIVDSSWLTKVKLLREGPKVGVFSDLFFLVLGLAIVIYRYIVHRNCAF